MENVELEEKLKKMFKIAKLTYECSVLMEEFNKDASDALLKTSHSFLREFEMSKYTEEQRQYIVDIEREICDE